MAVAAMSLVRVQAQDLRSVHFSGMINDIPHEKMLGALDFSHFPRMLTVETAAAGGPSSSRKSRGRAALQLRPMTSLARAYEGALTVERESGGRRNQP